MAVPPRGVRQPFFLAFFYPRLSAVSHVIPTLSGLASDGFNFQVFLFRIFVWQC
jgi:hypothetical protein